MSTYIDRLRKPTTKAERVLIKQLLRRLIPTHIRVLIADDHEGKNTKQIAALLSISPKTVETHRSRLMHKTGIHEIAGLVPVHAWRLNSSTPVPDRVSLS